MFLTQSEEDARHVRDMGADHRTVEIAGMNMKYDRIPEPAVQPDEVERWAKQGLRLQPAVNI